MNISSANKPLYVYLQRPDNGQWVVVGRYKTDPVTSAGLFRYAPSYVEAGLSWAIDPVNLPFIAGEIRQLQRYGGLHDVLRDACPDSWGQTLLRRAHGLPEGCTALRYLVLSGNGDRWGALAVGTSASPNVASLSSPRLPQLEALVQELLAIAENRPPLNAALRKRLFATPSLGGARPKATIQDGDTYWLVKPGLLTDTVDIALLEHATQQWGRHAGFNFADTRLHVFMGGRSIVRVLRFDRHGHHRVMAVSGASLLQVEYPPTSPADSSGASYPRLAEELRRIGAPREDWTELFGRMVFNAVVGNDDDHPRNHAVIYAADEKRWRLAPAFDVVPNPDETPKRLVMQVCSGRSDISRVALLKDFARFGFASHQAAATHLDELLVRIQANFDQVARLLGNDLRSVMETRLVTNCTLLSENES
ncbi:HipA domain-containing protein [Glaciimonas sp. CA11.2]|uniref:type II toxin-antitoxin system HipA family toxin n=1 Tax=Glaciimonas sp. CA11.2 TaxID=3048601 RepID=UPI002AB33455|nr:HipA domain-containing protein [Glaciimonas sp. CA11.2]MDY7549183.1 HipA domain-containing protein [Glaciimonas sp. CA11.2]MEB0161504.1 HipA domain-containing protein [Glaciimonas sp. CA11.2]